LVESFGMNLAWGVRLSPTEAIARDGMKPRSEGQGVPKVHFSTKVELCRDALASGATLRFRIRGTSMLPALWPGESVAVRPIEFSAIRTGDLAVFVRNRHLVVHRVVRRIVGATGIGIITRGDAQFHDDPPFGESELLGVVATVHRFGASRCVPRRLPLLARGVAWTIQRSARARSVLNRLNFVGIGRAWAPATVPCCANANMTGVRRRPSRITLASHGPIAILAAGCARDVGREPGIRRFWRRWQR